MTYRGVGTEDHKWLAGGSVTGGLIARLEILVLGLPGGTSDQTRPMKRNRPLDLFTAKKHESNKDHAID
jgi:hypothetical protein